MTDSTLRYTGIVQPQEGEQDATGQLISPYFPEPELVEIVNLAIYLGRPLLLKGEPGCGKTQLAQNVAYELKLPLETWYIKSTSRARDGLYIYDAVGRLRDAQLASSDRLTAGELERLSDPNAYIRWQPLGRAFQNSQCTVVLIDEIDKADIDFPNDLLLELDEQRFFVEELEVAGAAREIRARVSPIVIITSNDEKDLPDAFLRRCLFHYVRFPSQERLVKIVQAHLATASQEPSPQLVEVATQRFCELRQAMQDQGTIGKKISTSELIDWVRVLNQHPTDEAIAMLDGKLPYAGVLLKNWDDHIRYLKQDILHE
ncbi:MAG: MoxR family ATPase [Leptolyngbya sp. SIO4C1]|nr:MoxR family ATPase [Leptolyngbya sp. SIO4C1]